MSERKHIFLSYRSLERAFALKLAAELRNAGVPVWVDSLPEGIRPGDDWPQTLEEALNTCRALIAAVSPDYVASKICRRELHRADQLSRPIFPVLLKPLAAEQWPLEIERLQYIDFTAWSSEPSFRTAFQALLGRLQSDLSEIVGQRPDPEQQYLFSLIADLEGRGGVSDTYVALAADLISREEPAERGGEEPLLTAMWGLDAEFMLLETGGPQRRRKSAPGAGPRRIEDILQIIAEPGRFVLLGEAGAGKTTLLRRLALEAARRRLSDSRANPLPLLLRLPDWRAEPDPLGFIRSFWPFESDSRPAIAGGQVILFLDGLNEMGGRGLEKAQLLKKWFASPQGPQRLVVTCRAPDYTKEMNLGLDEVRIQPMDDERIRRLAAAYLREEAPGFLQRIQPGSLSPDHPRSLFALARNPYLLTCLMILHRSSPQRELPRNIGKLFSRLVKFLWNRELIRQTRGWAPFERAEPLFAALASWMVARNLPTSAPWRAALDVFGSDELIHAGLSANLLDVDGQQVRFYHQLILEYFAALDLARDLTEARLKAFLDNYRVNQEAVYLKEEWWPLGDTRRNVITSLAGIVPDVDQFFALLSKRDPDLAADCAMSGIELQPATTQRIMDELSKKRQYWFDRALSYGLSSYDGDGEHLAAIYGSEDNGRYFEWKLAQFRQWLEHA